MCSELRLWHRKELPSMPGSVLMDKWKIQLFPTTCIYWTHSLFPHVCLNKWHFFLLAFESVSLPSLLGFGEPCSQEDYTGWRWRGTSESSITWICWWMWCVRGEKKHHSLKWSLLPPWEPEKMESLVANPPVTLVMPDQYVIMTFWLVRALSG